MAEREILFRGKIINCDLVVSKEWIYGSYCDEAKSPIRLKGEKDYILCPHISKYDQHYYLKGFGNLGAPYFYEVHPETVGQYIGVLDKNEKKIFNGDIVKTKYGRICEVYWFAPKLCWDLRPIECKSKAPDEYDLFKSENLEIVGNIHDNIKIIGNYKIYKYKEREIII